MLEYKMFLAKAGFVSLATILFVYQYYRQLSPVQQCTVLE